MFSQGNWSVNNLRCPKCFPQRKSYNEFKINDIFDNIFQNNTRKVIPPLELDLYSDKHKLAIEYDGLMFHSYGISKLSYLNNHTNHTNENCYQHLNKTQLCNEIGVSLLHIFESEWCNDTKQGIWISIISNKIRIK